MTECLPPVRRGRDGRYVPTLCTDPNCGGALQLAVHESWDGRKDAWWECDGLTHETDGGPLEVCARAIEAPRRAA